jgi:flagellar biosynthesis protein FliQ
MNEISTILITVLSSSVVAGIVSSIFQGRQKVDEYSRDISKEIVDNIFSGFIFEPYSDSQKSDINKELVKFCKKIREKKYLGYLRELYEDATYLNENMNSMTSHEFTKCYRNFRVRFLKANKQLLLKIGIKKTATPDNLKPFVIMMFTGLVIVLVGYFVAIKGEISDSAFKWSGGYLILSGFVFTFIGMIIFLGYCIGEMISDFRIFVEKKFHK